MLLDFSSAAKDAGASAASFLTAQGDRESAKSYNEASDIALQNEQITKSSEQITQTQLDRKIYQTLGSQQADVAASGFANSGSALDLMRSSASQGALDKAVAGEQGLIQEQSYSQQSALFIGMSKAAEAAGQAATAQGVADAAASALDIFSWIICTELMFQKRLPRVWWIKGARVFASYPEPVRQGYYLWAIPSVAILRAKPNSRFSRALCALFNWRAENIAAAAGVRGARRLLRGAAVTAFLWPLCYLLGVGVLLTVGKLEWRAVYA